jgi:hypothetical protein
MTLDYQKVWNTLNELESVTSKICSAREILDSALDALENHKKDKAETLMYAVDEYLQYYLEEFDRKFKDAWNETVMKLKQDETDAWDAVMREKEYYEPSMPPWGHSDMEYVSQYSGSTVSSCDKDDTTPECKGAWNSFWEENYYLDEYKTYKEAVSAGYEMTADGFWIPPQKEDKVVKWQLPVDKIENGDTGEDEYFITFPDDLLKAANLNPGDEVYWEDKNDGTFILRKVTKPLGGDEC